MNLDTKYNVKIGEVKIIKNSKDIVWTILGSCIAVVFHVRNDLALICHAQYPAPRNYTNKCSGQCPLPCFTNLSDKDKFKYVSCSLEYMISYLKRNKVSLNKIHTSLLGGASAFNLKNDEKTFGEQNIIKAKEILTKHHIKINQEITGGNDGCTLWYYVNNNKLICNKHNKENMADIQSNSA